MRRRVTMRLRWGVTGERLIVQRLLDDEVEQTLTIVKPGENVDVLLDCCGEPHVMEAIGSAASQTPGGETE